MYVKMRNNFSKGIIALICSILVFYFYTFLHEGGHALIGLISNGKVDKMTLGLNARIYISGASFNPFTEAIYYLSGVLLPVIVLMISLIFYNPNARNQIYHISFGLFYIFILGSLLAWLFVPLMSLFTLISVGDDISKFLTTTAVHPFILSSVTSGVFCILLYIGYKKGIFIKTRELLTEARSGTISGNRKLSLKMAVPAVLLGLALFLAFVIHEKQKGVLRTSFTTEISSSAEERMFPFEITKSRMYRFDLSLQTKGILIDTQLYNESGQLIYHIMGEQVTLNKPINLKKGSYLCLLTFMTDAAGMKEHFKKNGYPRDEERILSLTKILNNELNMKHHVDFSATIR
jgi:hypothetical protein